MTLSDFAYHRPGTVAEACRLGRELGAEAAFLAGGTELFPDFRRGADARGHLIALGGVPGLAGIAADGGGLRIGAMTTIREIAGSPAVRETFPALAEAARALGGPQIRSQATIGGNFCRAVPCADTPPPAIVAGATLRIAGLNGERTILAADFFVGPRRTVLEPGELLLDVVIPRQPAESGASYQRFSLRRGSALAVAAVAARVALDGGMIGDARIVLGAVAPVPLPATRAAATLVGRKPTDELFARAAAAAALEARPITDLRGTAAFRRELVAVLTRRALLAATARAVGRA